MEDNDILDSLRSQIDNSDREILLLLKRRFQTAKKIAEVKQRLNMELFQLEREEFVIKDRVSKAKEYGIAENFTRKLFQLIIDESRLEQERLIEKKRVTSDKNKSK